LTRAPVVAVRTKGDLVAQSYESNGADTLVVSALTGAGIGALQARLEALVQVRVGDDWRDTPLLTRERHRAAIARARSEVGAFRDAWSSEDASSAVPVVIAAVHLRAAALALESLIGVIEVEDVLDHVFRTFCVGK
jgi:tRNA modification GTPase